MKSYKKVVLKIADTVWHNTMNGDIAPWVDFDLATIAYIYGKKEDKVFTDVNKAFKKQIKDYKRSKK